MTLASALRNILTEMAATRSTFKVAYVVTSPSGNHARFERGGALSNMYGNPQSETAVLAYLRKLHPQAKDISIQNLSFE